MIVRRLILAALFLLAGCAPVAPEPHVATRYPDGIYRGTYYDYSTEQLAVEFEMKDQRFEDIRFIGMCYRDGDYLKPDATQAQQAIVTQYQTAADYLLKKGVDALTDLYEKVEIIPDVDAVTGATLKSSAVVSAIYDGLSRMPYSWDGNRDFEFETPVCNGNYRGFFYEDGLERIAVAFEMKDELFIGLQIRTLKDEQGRDCAQSSSAYQTVSRCLAYLKNKPLSALTELDGVVTRMPRGDSRMAEKLRCAIFGGLSRAPFQSDDAARFFESVSVADGTYRGHYYDKGTEQLSVQFEVENGWLHNVLLRGKQEDTTDSVQLEKCRQALLLLEGAPIAAVSSLYSLSDDSFEAGELTYAIADALARGLYKPSNASLLPMAQTAVDGVHSGGFKSDDLIMEVELLIQQDYILSANLTGLKMNGIGSSEEKQTQQLLTEQLATLSGKPLAQINKLYQWKNPLAVPLISALWDAVEANSYDT